jgi:tRNA (cmo5U34)-methyltransferase
MPKESVDEIQFRNVDLNGYFEVKNACLVYSIFTMQFLNREKRQGFCDIVYKGLNDGAAFILCEKIYQEDGLLQEIMSFTHYDYKCNHFTEEEIIKKERDLRYIMKPNTLNANITLLNNSGFNRITTFWQSYNFIGLIAIK